MEVLDIHTHHLYPNPLTGILNCLPKHFKPGYNGYYSVGYHPWYLSEEGIEDWSGFINIVSSPQVLAIGEAGLDKLTTTGLDIQEKAFIKQAEIASGLNKPLIIHCVKAYNEIIRFKKNFSPEVAWIIHGFRGKKELATQLLDHGFYLSFGENYQEDALRITPLNRMFIETDESKIDINTLYERAAGLISIKVTSFKKAIKNNISEIFF